jgi:site-specific DNA-methyltransferase (adenine-specific)/modification methylase
VDAVVTDPPYGISAVKNGKCFQDSNVCAVSIHKEIVGDDRPFDPRPLLGIAPVICLFGANHYSAYLPSQARWLIWDKRDGMNSNPLADCEMAWTNDSRPARVYSQRWMGMIRDGEKAPRLHPSQKPVELMMWVLDTLDIPVGATVFDPYCGSGTTGVACIQTGRNFIGVEIDPGYAEIARRRCADAAPLFVPQPRQPEPMLLGATT